MFSVRLKTYRMSQEQGGSILAEHGAQAEATGVTGVRRKRNVRLERQPAGQPGHLVSEAGGHWRALGGEPRSSVLKRSLTVKWKMGG